MDERSKWVVGKSPDSSALISDLLASGTYIGDVKVIARHTSESTTLRHAKAHDTKVIKSRAKLRY